MNKNKNLEVVGIQLDYTNNEYFPYDRIKEEFKKFDFKNFDLVILPELCLLGFDYNLMSDFSKIEFENQISFFKEIAEKNKINLISGILEIDGDDYFNSAIAIGSDGNILYKHRKLHLWKKEREFFQRGNHVGTFEIDGWNIGLGICADIGFPEFSRLLVLKGADLLVFPSAWRKPYDRLWKQMVVARAAENQTYVLGVNAVGSDEKFCGKSLVVSPDGYVEEELGDVQSFLSARLKKQNINKRRQELDWLSMRRPDIYDIERGD